MMVFAFLQPDTARNVLLILLGVGYLGYHVRHWWRRRPKAVEKKVKGEEKVKVAIVTEGRNSRSEANDLGQGQDEVEKVGLGQRPRSTAEGDSDSAVQPTNGGRERTPAAPQSPYNEIALKRDSGGPGVSALPQRDESGALRPVLSQPQPPTSTSSLTGEALFDRARALPHQMVPDFEMDGPYLDLLGQSAAAGYAPALAKLGEYAMRRAAWVEAYYWMSMAKRQGMQGLANVMCEIRKNWSLDGFPDEAENVNPLFTVEAGSIGRAFLHVDSGHEASKAREFLKAIHPEFLS